MAASLSKDEQLVLNHLMRALSERGWLPSTRDLIDGLEARGEAPEAMHSALGSLTSKRLLTLDDEGSRIEQVLATITAARTSHRGHLESGVNVFTLGGFELFCLSGLFVQAVDGSSRCGKCESPISFRLEEGQVVELNPHGAAAFQANWDGQSPIKELCERSPLFCSNACMSAWTDDQGEPDGLPISSDLLLHVGVMFAQESAEARFSMFGLRA